MKQRFQNILTFPSINQVHLKQVTIIYLDIKYFNQNISSIGHLTSVKLEPRGNLCTNIREIKCCTQTFPHQVVQQLHQQPKVHQPLTHILTVCAVSRFGVARFSAVNIIRLPRYLCSTEKLDSVLCANQCTNPYSYSIHKMWFGISHKSTTLNVVDALGPKN